MDILFTIVTYREALSESNTFRTLVRSFDQFKKENPEAKLHLFVFDNTDAESWKMEIPSHDDIEIFYYRDDKNPGISAAYNNAAAFALEKKFRWIVFLDQDSELGENAVEKYHQYIKNTKSPVAMPLVYANDTLISPSRMVFERTRLIPEQEILGKTSLPFKNVTGINTGLMVRTDFFFEAGGYNPNLRIDFCDHDFLLRTAKKTNEIGLLDFKILQDFSANTNTVEKDIVRYRIFVKDIRNYAASNPSGMLFFTVDLPHLLKLSLKHRSLQFFKIRFS